MENINIESTVKLLTETLVNWWEAAVKGLPSLVLAILVLFTAYLAAKVVRKIISGYVPRFVHNTAVVNLTATVGFIVVICIGLFFALGILQLEKTVTSLLAGAGVIGLALGFAFQEIASNFVAGVIIAVRQPFKIGDIVECNDTLGSIEAINLRETVFRAFDGIQVIVPNKDLLTDVVKNYTDLDQRRIAMSLGVSYSDDLRKVPGIIESALESIPERVQEKPVQVHFKSFGASSIDFDVFVWIKYPGNNNFYNARSEMVMRIKEALDENGFNIPFPIRTLDINNGHNKNLVKPIIASLESH